MIRILIRLDAIPAARHYQLEGSKLYNTLHTQAQDQQAFDRKFSTFRLTEIDLLIGENEPALAFKQAEFYKNRALTWLLDPPNPLIKGEPNRIGNAIDDTNDNTRNNNLPITTLNPKTPGSKVPLIKGDLGGSIVYWHQSNDAITTFILDSNESLIVLACDRYQQYKRFIAWKDKWDNDYEEYRSKKSVSQSDHPWRQKMRDRLATLRDILAIDQILTHLPIDRPLILIPHRDLHRYPIHSLFDRPITHAPSLQALTRPENPTDRPSLLTIADPETAADPMPYARLESAILHSLLQSTHPTAPITPISPDRADRPTVLQTLQTHHTHFHFTGHAIHNAQFPNRSALQLKQDSLTANTIAQLNLNHLNLAILAACETAIVNPDDTSDYIGLQSAFLRAGTRTILSTLWNIPAFESAWFTARFYQMILTGMTPIIALQQTQHWFQTAPIADFQTWLHHLAQLDYSNNALPDLDPARELRIAANLLPDRQGTMEPGRDSGDRPYYAHPYYWAAFTLTGPGNP